MKILSQIDAITNSSTEVFIIKGIDPGKKLKQLFTQGATYYILNDLIDIVDAVGEDWWEMRDYFGIDRNEIPPKPVEPRVLPLHAYISIIVNDLGFSRSDAIELRNKRIEKLIE